VAKTSFTTKKLAAGGVESERLPFFVIILIIVAVVVTPVGCECFTFHAVVTT
jgi:hypothetical protein